MTSKAFELAQLGDAVTVDSSKVGIGTSSPDLTLDVTHGTEAEYVATFQNTGDNLELKIGTSTGGMLNIQGANASNNNAYAFGLNADGGKVGIGTNDPDALAHVYSGASGVTNPHSYTKLHIESADHNAIQLSGSSGGEQWIWFADDTSATPVGGITYYHGDNYMAFRTNGGEKLRISQHGELIGPSNNDFDIKTGSGTGDMRFYTNGSQRARIDSGGDLLVGASSFSYSGSHDCVQIMQSEGRINIENDVTAGSKYVIAFYNPNGNVGKITTSGSSTSYSTSSDYRLKENVADIADGITRVKQLAPKRFNFIADPETIVDGFLAHEAGAVVPEAVTGEKDEVDADGNAVMQGIDQSKLVPLLTAALQEAIAKIETLETENVTIKARLDALEAN